MKRSETRAAVSLALMIIAAGGGRLDAQASGPLVSAAWLADRLDEPGLVLLHVGDRAGYGRSHIRGSRWADLDLVSTPHIMDAEHLMLELPPAEQLRARLERLGISDDSRVVVVAAEKDDVPAATRVLLTLEHLGLGERALLLDGGLAAWTAERRPVTKDVPAPRRVTLTPRSTKDVVATADWLNARRGKQGYAVVDARDRRFYTSTQAEPGDHRPGHIPSAVNVPYHSVLDEMGRFRDTAALRALFREAGVAEGDVVIGYCHIGMQATTTLLAARLIGHEVLLYDGSFEDWSRRTDLPVTSR